MRQLLMVIRWLDVALKVLCVAILSFAIGAAVVAQFDNWLWAVAIGLGAIVCVLHD